jgi:hypothetical protein
MRRVKIVSNNNTPTSLPPQLKSLYSLSERYVVSLARSFKEDDTKSAREAVESLISISAVNGCLWSVFDRVTGVTTYWEDIGERPAPVEEARALVVKLHHDAGLSSADAARLAELLPSLSPNERESVLTALPEKPAPKLPETKPVDAKPVKPVETRQTIVGKPA